MATINGSNRVDSQVCSTHIIRIMNKTMCNAAIFPFFFFSNISSVFIKSFSVFVLFGVLFTAFSPHRRWTTHTHTHTHYIKVPCPYHCGGYLLLGWNQLSHLKTHIFRTFGVVCGSLSLQWFIIRYILVREYKVFTLILLFVS